MIASWQLLNSEILWLATELELYSVYHNSTIAHDMLHLLLYMAPDIIYLLGCDCSPTGYFDDRSNPGQMTMDA